MAKGSIGCETCASFFLNSWPHGELNPRLVALWCTPFHWVMSSYNLSTFMTISKLFYIWTTFLCMDSLQLVIQPKHVADHSDYETTVGEQVKTTSSCQCLHKSLAQNSKVQTAHNTGIELVPFCSDQSKSKHQYTFPPFWREDVKILRWEQSDVGMNVMRNTE